MALGVLMEGFREGKHLVHDLLAHVGVFPFCKGYVGLLDDLRGRPAEDIVWAAGLVIGAWKDQVKINSAGIKYICYVLYSLILTCRYISHFVLIY